MKLLVVRLRTVLVIGINVVLLIAVCVTDARGVITHSSLFSPAHGRPINFSVYTPPGYKPHQATRYPVVFSMHGNGGKPSQRAASYAPTLDKKTRSGEIIPMIWVFPDGQKDTYYGDAFDDSKMVYTHIIDELVPHVDATLRTIGNRDNRALEGFSVGGYGAALYAATDPELFSATVLYGAVLPTWPELVRKEADVASAMYNNDEANWLPYSVYDVTRDNAAVIGATVAYKQIVGDADGHLRGNIRFRDYLLSLGIDSQFQVLPGVSHGGFMYLNEGSGLRFLNNHFLQARNLSIGLTAVPESSALVLAGIAGTLSGLFARTRHPSRRPQV